MTTFTYNGTDLSTLGNITVIDGYLDMPERRGSNVELPFRDGTVFTSKYYDERVIVFGIAVLGSSLSDLETKMNTIRALFSQRTQKTLSITYEDASVKTAQVTIDKPLQVSRVQSLARIVVEMTMSKPYFRLSTAIADNTVTIDASPKAMTVSNPGSVEERDPVIILTGPLTNPVITNSTNGCVLTYTGAIDAGHTVTIQTATTGEYTATHSVSGNVIGNITHSGAPCLMVFDVGDNTMSITSSVTTTGTVKVSFYAPFM
jgi:phage-related protein